MKSLFGLDVKINESPKVSTNGDNNEPYRTAYLGSPKT